MSISAVTQPNVQANLNKLLNSTRVIGQYIGDSANPGLVPDADAAVGVAAAAASALSGGSSVSVTDGTTVTGVTGTGTTATLHVSGGVLTISLA
jgi:hypothetical protein